MFNVLLVLLTLDALILTTAVLLQAGQGGGLASLGGGAGTRRGAAPRGGGATRPQSREGAHPPDCVSALPPLTHPIRGDLHPPLPSSNKCNEESGEVRQQTKQAHEKEGPVPANGGMVK